MELIDQLEMKFNDLEQRYEKAKSKKGRLVLRARQLEINESMMQIVANQKEQLEKKLAEVGSQELELKGRRELIKDEIDEEVKSR